MLFSKLLPDKFKNIVKDLLLYYFVIKNKFNSIKMKKICLFYLPQVPDFGPNFIYIKLGENEKINNPNNYNVIFETKLDQNISKKNKVFYDYSGLYALYKNNLIDEEYMLLIHYDTKILHKKWIDIISACVKNNNVVFSEWAIDNEKSEISKWVYERIDDVLLSTHKKSFLSYLKTHNISKIPNSSQFACHRETFNQLMEFLLPIYDYILAENEPTFKYAHLLERAWGLFFAMEEYKKIAIIKDTHSQSVFYGENRNDDLITIPILSTALNNQVNKFKEIL